MTNNPNYNPFYTDDAAITRYENRKSRMLVDNREQMADRFKPGGDKYESIKADEAWEKAHANEEIVDISEENIRSSRSRD